MYGIVASFDLGEFRAVFEHHLAHLNRLPGVGYVGLRDVLAGELGKRLASAFEWMEMEARSGETVLTGEVIDQSHPNSTHSPQLGP